MTTSELLSIRAAQLSRREEFLEKVRKRVYQERQKRVDDKIHKDGFWIREISFEKGDLVLVRNSKAIDKGQRDKMADRYAGPFIVIARTLRGNYLLADMDGARMRFSTAAKRVIR